MGVVRLFEGRFLFFVCIYIENSMIKQFEILFLFNQTVFCFWFFGYLVNYLCVKRLAVGEKDVLKNPRLA